MKSVRKLIPTALGRPEVVRAALAHRVLRAWPELVGPEMAERSAPDRFERGTVFVAVSGSAWAQELRLKKPEILRRLRERAGDAELFTDLRFGVRPFSVLTIDEPPTSMDPAPPDHRSIREIADARLRTWDQ
jgi:predicted nucleic acid-binding Zn ribbon protein